MNILQEWRAPQSHVTHQSDVTRGNRELGCVDRRNV
jgi:hypothetical protein